MNRILLMLVGVLAVVLWAMLRMHAVDRLEPLTFDRVLSPSAAPASATDSRAVETIAAEPATEAGVTVSGLVRDDHGALLEGVHVWAYSSSGAASDFRSCSSSADGSFRLETIPAGEVELHAELEGYTRTKQQLGKLGAGETRDGFELVLVQGHILTGRVTWSDGSPAEAWVEVSWGVYDMVWADRQKTDADGGFRFTGLAGVQHVTARASRVVANHVVLGTAEQHDVKGGSDLSLVLTPSTQLAVIGRVVDDLGVAVPNPNISAFDADSNHQVMMESFSGDDGSFLVEGLPAGEWSISAEAEGYVDSPLLPVRLPSSSPVTLVLVRKAKVRGVVRGPSGVGVAGATVRISRDDLPEPTPLGLDADAGFPGRRRSRRNDDSVRSAADGTFAFGSITPGRLVLIADHAEMAPSLPVELELAAGEERDGIELRLRAGASIVGDVANADGTPVVGRDVITFGGGQPGGRRSATDEQGRFEFRGLPAGEITLSTLTNDEIELRRTLVLSEGETEHVRLSPTAAPLVRLHGRVLAAGEPLADAGITVQSHVSSVLLRAVATTNAEGEYELQLPGPGVYTLSIDASFFWQTSIDVPDVDDLERDVSIPVGRISGRVTDARGEPAFALFVGTEPELHGSSGFGGGFAITREDGRYDLVVPPGRHTVVAGNRELPRVGEPSAEARVTGLLVEPGASLTGVDLRLLPGGTLEGVARTEDGAPVSNASLWSFEEPRPRRLGTSGSDGRFRLENLTPGEIQLGASLERSATARRVTVRIAADTVEHVELVLSPAAPVRVTVRRAGALIDAELVLVDENGATYPMRSERPGEASFGPLTRGRYRVSARDGTSVERVLEILGTEERVDVELALE